MLSLQRPFTLIGSPFLLLFVVGYSGVGLLRLLDQYARRPVATTRVPPRATAVSWRRLSLPRFATGAVGVLLVAGVALAALGLASPSQGDPATLEPAARGLGLGLDLTNANWQPVQTSEGGMISTGAIKSVHVERGSLVLGIELDEKTHEGAINLDLKGAMLALGDSLGRERQLAYHVEYSSRFTGEFQAFVKDRQGRSEYGSMEIVESHDIPHPVTVSLIPEARLPAMGYEDTGFDPAIGIGELGFKISAQSDRVRGAGYRPFRGTIRIAGVRIGDSDRAAHPDPRDSSVGTGTQAACRLIARRNSWPAAASIAPGRSAMPSQAR